MFKPQHCGLYFSEADIELARKERRREPLRTAWTFLLEQEQSGELAAVQWDALRFRFNSDAEAGERAVKNLQKIEFPENTPFLDTAGTLLTLAQCYEMLRDEAQFSIENQERWRTNFAARVDTLNQLTVTEYHETVWLAALNLAAGVVLENEARFEQGAEVYRRIVREDIKPDGYIPGAVEAGDKRGFFRQLLTAQALVLMAEAAQHVGVDLWGYESRGVSAVTAASYLIFYYYYPQKWRWDKDLVEDDVQPLLRRHAGFLEMVYRRRPLRDFQVLLKALRPVYDVWGGGLTTLTHGAPLRRGWLG